MEASSSKSGAPLSDRERLDEISKQLHALTLAVSTLIEAVKSGVTPVMQGILNRLNASDQTQ